MFWAVSATVFAGISVTEVIAATGASAVIDVTVTALGAGATGAAVLGRMGFRVDALAVAVSVLLAGIAELAASAGVSLLARGWFYGALLGVWVLCDLTRWSPLLRRGSARRSLHQHHRCPNYRR